MLPRESESGERVVIRANNNKLMVQLRFSSRRLERMPWKETHPGLVSLIVLCELLHRHQITGNSEGNSCRGVLIWNCIMNGPEGRLLT